MKGRFVIENRHNTITSTLFRLIMKEIDDTPLPENESEDTLEDALRVIAANATYALLRMDELELRIANLETQRTPQDENDDPEWYG